MFSHMFSTAVLFKDIALFSNAPVIKDTECFTLATEITSIAQIKSWAQSTLSLQHDFLANAKLSKT